MAATDLFITLHCNSTTDRLSFFFQSILSPRLLLRDVLLWLLRFANGGGTGDSSGTEIRAVSRLGSGVGDRSVGPNRILLAQAICALYHLHLKPSAIGVVET